MSLVCSLLQVYAVCLFARVILSWFPLGSGSPLATVYSFLHTVTEPVLAPLRRVMPPLGGFDLSPLVVFFLIQIICQGL